MSNTNASSAPGLAEGKLTGERWPFGALSPSASFRSLTVAVMLVSSLSQTLVTHSVPLRKAFPPFSSFFSQRYQLLSPPHSLSPYSLSFLSTHPFCQRLIGLEMILFILDSNAVILRKKKYATHALKPNLKERMGGGWRREKEIQFNLIFLSIFSPRPVPTSILFNLWQNFITLKAFSPPSFERIDGPNVFLVTSRSVCLDWRPCD